MSNLVPVFYELLRKMEASRMSCGVILADCKNLSKDWLETMKRDLEQTISGITAHYSHDKNKNLFGVLLEQQTLSDTHFHSLLLKDYLMNRNLLSGSLLIASFPESFKSSGQMLMRMIQDMKDCERVGEIKIYDHQDWDRETEAATILLVNHDRTVNEFLSIYLERKGYQVAVAHDGMDGVQKFREIHPDLVITDLNLPIMNGYQLMEHIKQLESEGISKIVVLTDKRLEEDVQKSFALGASDYITKPFSPVELEARVKRLIS
jgi:two-component system OmpR family response regulator